MAAKKAKAKAKKSTKKAVKLNFEKQTPAHYKAIAAGINKGKAPETCGELIRARIVEGKLTNEEILKEALKSFKGNTAMSDVYWQRGRLKKEGINLPKAERAAPAAKAEKPAKKAKAKPAAKKNKKAVKKAPAKSKSNSAAQPAA